MSTSIAEEIYVLMESERHIDIIKFRSIACMLPKANHQTVAVSDVRLYFKPMQ